jgi:glutamine amidotransferase
LIVIVDYGSGNPSSVANMLKRIGHPSIITSQIAEISKASKIILPGVGSFDAAMDTLESSGLKEVLEEKALGQKVPFLGICLGMQLLTYGSEEGIKKGFGWIPAYTYKFKSSPVLKVPHMCWNTVRATAENSLLQGLSEESRFYFVHSYYVKTEAPQYSFLQTQYGISFSSGIANNNIFGVQFHPEKSHKYGMTLLANFVSL